jgi:hypothetical protein
MEQRQEEMKEILCKAIKERRLIQFYYESEKSKKKEWRMVQPYIVGIKENGNVFLAALPVSELQKRIEDRITPHYLLKKININKLELLPEKYDKPEVARKRIVDTPTIKVICRFFYEDEKQ